MIKNSILLCTYNEGKYIKDSVKGIKNIENSIIVITLDT